MKVIIHILLIVVFISCEDVPLQESYNISEYTEKYIEENKEIYLVDNASSSFELQTINGCEIVFEENSFLKNGLVFGGEIKFRFLFVPDRIAMIKSGMPSVYKDSDDNISLMESGGEFLLEAYDNSDGEELSSSKFYLVNIPRSLTDASSNNMGLFLMDDQDSKFWTKWPGSPANGFTGVINSEERFQLIVQNFGWINCDDIIYTNGISYEFSIRYPLGFDESNSYVFLALDSFPNSIGNLSLKVPENEKGKIFIVARNDDYYYLASDSFIATSDMKFDFSSTNLKEISIEDFDKYLASLL